MQPMTNKDVGQLHVQRFIIISSAVRLVMSVVKLIAWSNTMTSKPLFLEFEQSEIHRTDSLMLPTQVNNLWMAPLNRRNKWQPFPDSRNAQCKMCNIIRKLFVLSYTELQSSCAVEHFSQDGARCLLFIVHHNKYMNHEACIYGTHFWVMRSACSEVYVVIC